MLRNSGSTAIFSPARTRRNAPVLVAGVPQVVLEPEWILCEYAVADEGDSGFVIRSST
jgi:hypothetical protein